MNRKYFLLYNICLNLQLVLFLFFLYSCSSEKSFDIIIKNGTIIDGSGNKSFSGDIGVKGDTIAAMGNLSNENAIKTIDATGLVVAPGFVNMLSQAHETLIIDGNSQSDIRQGVTLEILGEGWSMGPWNKQIKKGTLSYQKEYKYKIKWTTLGEYLQYLEDRGVSSNIASFVGATTIRVHEMNRENREPTLQEMERMKELTREAMKEGALGLSTALIYTPGLYASTEELIELCKVVSDYGGIYISHLRSEGDNLLKAIDELIEISAKANIAAEIYHFKVAGEHNWHKYEAAIIKIDSARSAGLKIYANMYTYTAAQTGLDAAMPPWVQEGGLKSWRNKLTDPEIRNKVMIEMNEDSKEWENFYYAAGSPDNILLIGFRNDSLKYLTGKTLSEIALLKNLTPEETAMNLVVWDGSKVKTVYFLMSEETIKKQITLPYMCFSSDAGSYSNTDKFNLEHPHPRAYGNFAKLLGKYVRDEGIISMEEAIYRLTYLPCSRLRIEKRGLLEVGYFADIVAFDASKIQDNATYENPKSYATGMLHVLVNGTEVIRDGEHTEAKPGRFIKGPGWKQSKSHSIFDFFN